jgi:hypothetical protein
LILLVIWASLDTLLIYQGAKAYLYQNNALARSIDMEYAAANIFIQLTPAEGMYEL